MSYSLHYLPPSEYATSALPSANSHLDDYGSDVADPTATAPRQDSIQQRKRPKYTRSKTGCLTCRVKKIKCDETKPDCVRCTHSQRECTWPDGNAHGFRKRISRRDSVDETPSATSSSVSSESSPSLRAASPPRRLDSEYTNLPPRRNTDPYVHLPAPTSDRHGFPRPPFHGSHSDSVHSVHFTGETIPYSSTTRYDMTYASSQHQAPHSMYSRSSSMVTGVRGIGHHEYWPSQDLLPPIEPMDYHYPALQERGMVGPPDHRFQ